MQETPYGDDDKNLHPITTVGEDQSGRADTDQLDRPGEPGRVAYNPRTELRPGEVIPVDGDEVPEAVRNMWKWEERRQAAAQPPEKPALPDEIPMDHLLAQQEREYPLQVGETKYLNIYFRVKQEETSDKAEIIVPLAITREAATSFSLTNALTGDSKNFVLPLLDEGKVGEILVPLFHQEATTVSENSSKKLTENSELFDEVVKPYIWGEFLGLPSDDFLPTLVFGSKLDLQLTFSGTGVTISNSIGGVPVTLSSEKPHLLSQDTYFARREKRAENKRREEERKQALRTNPEAALALGETRKVWGTYIESLSDLKSGESRYVTVGRKLFPAAISHHLAEQGVSEQQFQLGIEKDAKGDISWRFIASGHPNPLYIAGESDPLPQVRGETSLNQMGDCIINVGDHARQPEGKNKMRYIISFDEAGCHITIEELVRKE